MLFIGDSFHAHGRYTPVVRNYNSQTPGEPWQPPQVIDENFGQTGEREESPLSSGPWGGIPGIFSELAREMLTSATRSILEAISATSLKKNYGRQPLR